MARSRRLTEARLMRAIKLDDTQPEKLLFIFNACRAKVCFKNVFACIIFKIRSATAAVVVCKKRTDINAFSGKDSAELTVKPAYI